MNYINSYLSGPVANALGWTLLHALWQVFALVLPAALLLHVLRNQSSALRYRISVLTLLTQLLLSVATFIWFYQPTAHSSVHAFQASALNLGKTAPIDWQSVTHTLPWHQQLQQFLEAHLSQFVLLYLIGVALFGTRLAGGWVYLQRLSQTATQPTAAVWAQLTAKLRLALAIRAGIQIRESVQIATPMVIGVLKPMLLVPVGLATHLSVRELEAVLAHELAHVKRHDYLVNLLQSITEVLYFFHPALWWLSARVREEREHCCDDLAVQVCGGDGRVLAQALARVEELRLVQTDQTPALAIGFASQRQHLLHRVRRMLGVPTRPFVSNSSLAGLMLATVLLMSISVYGVQKQDKPKLSQPRPSHATRRHSKGSGTEYGMIDNKKLEYVIWKGQKLSPKSVARLQRQLDQVVSGKLSLDNVAQPNHDILLTVIETNQSFEGGMNSLAKGLSHIDYNNIVASALATVPLSLDGTVKGSAKVDYDSLVHNAFSSYSKAQAAFDSVPRQNFDNSHYQNYLYNQDSLANQRELNREKLALLKAQTQSQRFAVETVERKIERLERQQSILEQKRFFETSAQQQAILKSGVARTDSTHASLLKQIEAREQTIQTTESAIEKLNQQLINMQAELESAQKPLREIEAQVRKLNYSDQLTYLNYSEPGSAIPRPARSAKAPLPAKAATIPRPAMPSLNPRTLPKPAPAPKVDIPALPAKPE